VLAFVSGLYFPIDLLPGWLAAIAEWNPIALAVEGMRESLLGGAGWSETGLAVAILLPMSALALVVGFVAFRTALARERRLGTVGLY
jgi:ABC-2 type transport system permease protein